MDMSVLHKKVNIKITIAILSLEVVAALLSLFLIVYPSINVKPIKAADPLANYTSDFSIKADSIITITNPTKSLITTNDSTYAIVLPAKATTINSFAVSADINLNGNNSLARIILVDSNNNEYLVYEAFTNLNGTGAFSVSKTCEETCNLNNITPKNLKIQVNNASVTITGQSYAGSPLKAEIPRSQKVADKVALLNQQLQKSGAKWRAGVTVMSLLPLDKFTKNFVNPDDNTPAKDLPNLQGFQYYKGGIFEIKDPNAPKSSASSIIVPDNYEWTSWMTPVKNQGGVGTCHAFAIIGDLESQINLYYNQHLNLDLSEQEFVDMYIPWHLKYLLSCPIVGFEACLTSKEGIADEQCDPYVSRDYGINNQSNAVLCTSSRSWKNNNYKSWATFNDDKILKKAIITKGPIKTEINFLPYSDNLSDVTTWFHSMIISGYYLIKQNWPINNLPNGESIVITDPNDPLIGQTAWIFKNSWGNDWGQNGYAAVALPLSHLFGLVAISGPFNVPSSWNGKVSCVDNDVDGFCSWGISDQPPTGVCLSSLNCKKDATDKYIKDCDDSNNKLGPFISENNLNCGPAPATVTVVSPVVKGTYFTVSWTKDSFGGSSDWVNIMYCTAPNTANCRTASPAVLANTGSYAGVSAPNLALNENYVYVKKYGDTANTYPYNGFSNKFTVTTTPSSLTASISVSPTTVASGKCATLTWSSTNATAASITGPSGNVTKPLSGSETVCPTQATTYYTLFVSGSSGYAQANTILYKN